jgi:hypothetical protein
MFKKDNWTLGIAIGAILPLVFYGLTIMVLSQWGLVESLIYTPKPKTPGLIGLAANILAFRYYMVNLKFDKAGRGIMLTTFAYVIMLFIFL